jgi:DNA-binding response OmpR family regulator
MGGESDSAPLPRVLIVDDNLELAENIAEILTIEGYRTEVAGSAEEALPRLLGPEIDVLVTDYRLPGLDGAALVRTARVTRERLRAIVMSAFTDENTVNDAARAGAEFLPKPLDLLLLGRYLRTGHVAA